MDVSGGMNQRGTPLITYTPHYQNNQQWLPKDAGNGTISFRSRIDESNENNYKYLALNLQSNTGILNTETGFSLLYYPEANAYSISWGDSYLTAGPNESDQITLTPAPGGVSIYQLWVFEKVEPVVPNPAGVSINNKADGNVLRINQTWQLSSTVSPSNANQTVTWVSTNSGIASISSSGEITAHATGTTTIRATAVNGLNTSFTLTVGSSDPFEPINIEYMRLRRYPNSETVTVVTKSYLNSDPYFEALLYSGEQFSFEINSTLISELNAQEVAYQNLPGIFGVVYSPFYYHVAKQYVDSLMSAGVFASGSPEYYGFWVTSAHRQLDAAHRFNDKLQLAVATFTVVYSVCEIVSSIQAYRLAANTTRTLNNAVYKASASEVNELFNQLSQNGISFNKNNTMWIVRRPNGQISWLETGSDTAGFKHILQRHPLSQFSSFNVSTETGLSSLIFNTVSSKTPVGTYGAGGSVFSMGGGKYLNVVISSNGYIVTAENISNSVNGISFY